MLNKNGALLKIAGPMEGLIGPEGDAFKIDLQLLQLTPSFLAPVSCHRVEQVVAEMMQLDFSRLLSNAEVLADVRRGLIRTCTV